MVKSILIILSLVFTLGCSKEKIGVAPKVDEVENNITSVELNTTVKAEEANTTVIDSEFVPAHISNSTIESVPH